jgi:hypothetical protein
MNWIVAPNSLKPKNNMNGLCGPALLCGAIFAIIGGCLTTILCTDLCIVHCELDSSDH